MTRNEIMEIQATLNRLGVRDKNGNRLAVDGIIGPLTDSAIRNFQRAAGIPVTGVVGPITTDALRERNPDFVGPGNTYKPERRAQENQPIRDNWERIPADAPVEAVRRTGPQTVPQPTPAPALPAQSITVAAAGDSNPNNWVDQANNVFGTAVNVADHMGVPFVGDVGKAWKIANTGSDVINTLANSDLTLTQRAQRAGIQAGGALARFGVGYATSKVASASIAGAPKTGGISAFIGVPYAIRTNREINQSIDQLQNYWLNRLNLN